jgi:hypothetical protein
MHDDAKTWRKAFKFNGRSMHRKELVCELKVCQ